MFLHSFERYKKINNYSFNCIFFDNLENKREKIYKFRNKT